MAKKKPEVIRVSNLAKTLDTIQHVLKAWEVKRKKWRKS